MTGVRWAVCVLGLFALPLIGCSGGTRVADNPDPLKGNQPALPAVAKGQTQPVPLVSGETPYAIQPAPSSATATAALASGAVGQLSSSQDLRGGATSTGTRGAVTLSAPQVAKDGANPARLQTIIPAGGAGVQTVDQGLQYLQSQGVQGFRLERLRDTGKWRCTCVIPRREAPAIKQTYDIQDAADPLSALRAVIEQVEQNAH